MWRAFRGLGAENPFAPCVPAVWELGVGAPRGGRSAEEEPVRGRADSPMRRSKRELSGGCRGVYFGRAAAVIGHARARAVQGAGGAMRKARPTSFRPIRGAAKS